MNPLCFYCGSELEKPRQGHTPNNHYTCRVCAKYKNRQKQFERLCKGCGVRVDIHDPEQIRIKTDVYHARCLETKEID